MKNKPFKFSEWIKHAYDFEKGVNPVESIDNEVIVMAHPAHPKIRLNLENDIVSQVCLLPKSLQLYFFGLVWVGFCNLNNDAEWRVVKKILLSIFAYARENPRLHKKDMLWDDHALSERACVLIYLKEALVEKRIVKSIDDHLEVLIDNLDTILASKSWEGNNHRVFHLCAKWCVEKHHFNDNNSAKCYRDEIEAFFFTLINVDTGLSIEQSVSYYNFDIILLKMVSEFLESSGEKFKDPRLDFRRIESNKDKHLQALAFPDGELPAAGDTPLGMKVRKPMLSSRDREKLWHSLERAGHYRGASKNNRCQYHVITHNGESPHGHFSPLHVDLWIEKIGSVLVDSGGPYKYGDRLRYEWFRSSKAHNTINFTNLERNITQGSVFAGHVNGELKGVVQYGHEFLYRNICVDEEKFEVVDKVVSESEWTISWHFPCGLDITEVSFGEFKILSGDREVKLTIRADRYLEIQLHEGWLTYKSAEKVCAPYILLKGAFSGVLTTTFEF